MCCRAPAHRLVRAFREPISVDQSYFPLSIGERLVQEDLPTRDIFVILENDFGLHLTHADVQIEAISADEFLARHQRTCDNVLR